MAEMEIKALEWREARVSDKWERYDANSIVGHYEVLEWSDGGFGGSTPTEDGSKEFSCDSIEAAKAICQADFDRKIMSALSDTSSKG